MASATDDTPREEPREEPTTSTGSVPTITGAIPTITGALPVLEDEADHEFAHLPDEEELSRTRGKVTAMVIVVLTTLSAIGPLATDMYIPAFPEVASELSTTASRMQLTITAFFLGTASGQVVAGPLSDRMGRRAPLLIGIILCLLASIGCALAPSVEVLLMLRVLQGIGGGFGMVLGRAVLIDMTDGPELFRSMNIMQGVGGVAPIVAPLLGGIILVFGQWREIFLVIAAMSLISLLGVLFLIPESLPVSRRHSGGFRTFLRNVRALAAPPHLRRLHAGQRLLGLRPDGLRLSLLVRGPGDARLHLHRVLGELRDQLDGHDDDVAALGTTDPHHPSAQAHPGGPDRGVAGELLAADRESVPGYTGLDRAAGVLLHGRTRRA